MENQTPLPSKNAIKIKKVRSSAKSRNLCGACVGRPPVEGTNRCEVCTEAEKRARLAARQRAQGKGFCCECAYRPRADRLATRGTKIGQQVARCEECLHLASERAKARRNAIPSWSSVGPKSSKLRNLENIRIE